jgi:protein-S-isoprenylcysteine O-methyltransferase Ste14
MDGNDETPLARIRLHPFIVVLGCLYASLFGRRVWTVDLDSARRAVCGVVGVGLAVLGVLTLTLAYRAMARARTTINPREHTTTLVTSGVYRISRNPIYVGWFLVILGQGVASRSLFAVAVAVLMIGLLHWAVVLNEEAYLESAFGDEYARYRESVRRWL